MGRLRVLHIVGDGRPGGGTTVVSGLTRALAAPGDCDVHLASQTGSYALAPQPGVTMHEVDFSAGRFAPAMLARLSRVIDTVRPDILHAHGARAGLPLTLLPIARAVPLVYSVHGYHFQGKKGLPHSLGKMSEARIARQAIANVFVSGTDREMARSNGFLKDRSGLVIHNGVDLAALPPSRVGDPRCIGFLGRLSHPKNPLMAIAVLARLRDEGYRLLMVGGGEMEGEVRAAVKRHGLEALVDITGPLARADALRRIQEAGVLLLPSLWEGLPMAPLEAMGMDIPVVAARAGGIPEVVLHQETGLLVDNQDSDSYAQAIRTLASDSALKQSLVENAHRRLLSDFSQADMVSRHLALYRSLAASKKK